MRVELGSAACRAVDALANEGEVVVATRGIRDSRAAIGGDVQLGAIAHAAAINADTAALPAARCNASSETPRSGASWRS